MIEMAILSAGGVVLPAPTELSVNDEIIWSSNTGRVSSGLMVGDVVAEKKNLSIKWGILTESEVALIASKLTPGFLPLTFRDNGADITISSYRGTLQKEALGYIGDGIFYYRSVSVSIIQQ